MKWMAQNKGIPLQELAPHILREIATRAGVPAHAIGSITRRPPPPITRSSKIEKPLPPGEISGKTILVSTLEDPRIAVRNSEWATRGWTYQEGVLSTRRLVFLEQQMYWECNSMATNKSLNILDLYDPSHTRFADYMLSGIFDGDLHRVPELQYGFKTSDVNEVSEQVQKLDSHIRAFTSRNLSYDSDSLNAFLGVAARYSTNGGLCLLLGMPVWAGLFATGKPGLQDTFALSVSAWAHPAQRGGGGRRDVRSGLPTAPPIPILDMGRLEGTCRLQYHRRRWRGRRRPSWLGGYRARRLLQSNDQ